MMHKGTLLVTHEGSQVLSKCIGYLRKCGYDVIEADSAIACRDYINRHAPPLALCNLKAFPTDACQCCKPKRGMGYHTRPFVVQFSKGGPDKGNRGFKLNADEVLPHPERPSELLPWIKMFFRFKEMQDLYRSIVENISDAVLLADKEGRIIYVSPNVDCIFGYSDSEIIGMAHLSHLMQNERFSPAAMDTQGDIQNIETVISAKDGSARTIQVSVKKMAVDEGAWLYVCRDISQRVEREQMEEQLQQSHKMEAIGTLAGGIAHEFNNILGIIIGNTELAADEIAPANLAQDFLSEIRTACRRAKDVVHKILSFARKTTYDPQPVRIGALIDETTRFLRSTIPTTIEIRTNNQCQAETILADATEMNQIVMNLFTNAAHAMPDQQGAIDVGLEHVRLSSSVASEHRDLAPGPYVSLTVRDNGTGIAVKNIDRVFDPYFTTKDVDQGTGMGLAIVYGIVKKHGGHIQIHSNEGTGTKVTVLLPIMNDTGDAQQNVKEALPTGSESILVVDDDPPIVKMAGAVLKRLGYAVVATTSSAKALAMVEESPDHFELVITDMAMPDMAGDELYRKLVKIRSKMSVILCTGHSERIDEAGAKAMGISAFVSKPFDVEALAHTVRKVLDQR